MHKGKIIKIKNNQVFIKIEETSQQCEGCALSSLCKGKTIVINLPSLPLQEGENINLEFDWLKFIKYMFLFFFIPAFLFVSIISLLKNACKTLICITGISLLVITVYYIGTHRIFKKAQFFKIVKSV